MTDHIDLDELADDEKSDDEKSDDANDGDWLWRDDADADAASDPPPAPPTDDETGDTADASEASDANEPTGADSHDPADSPTPHVPRPNKDKPVGIPKESGGAGGAAAKDQPSGEGTMTAEDADGAESGSEAEAGGVASGPHGGGADDMTMAMTYAAAKALANPSAAFADAGRWADWVGIVGDVPAHVLNKFQRDTHLDLDFFNGSGMEPAERLADVDEHSMFYAERMVLVGREGQSGIAERAGWEFVTLAEAAEKADWELAP